MVGQSPAGERYSLGSEVRGAKIVLVGDHERVAKATIGAGAPFRAIADQIGHAELSDPSPERRLATDASVLFATAQDSRRTLAA
ncbi:hypothetical protein HGG72_23895, partial [Ochrobactrum pecoris]|nr:hypothetical protein [Brucella pecoris]